MKRTVVGLVVAGVLLGAPASAAQDGTEAPPGDIPSVSVLPVGTDPSDPNAGQWFVATVSPGQTARLTARILNPATVDQVVSLSLADLDFGDSGTPVVADVSEDVGTWGAFDRPSVSIPAGQQVEVGFSVTVPEGAEPGDHVGVVVAETRPQGEDAIRIVKRVATRLYVTVPGDAQPAFVIEDVAMQRDSSIFTRSITFTVTLRNTGRVRLQPTVTVDGREAKGSELLMSRSVEPYVVKVPVPAWGGPLKFDVEATARTETRQGPARTRTVSTFVIPWVPIAGLALLGALVFLVRRWLRRRVGRYDALRGDLRRLERLVAERAAGNEPLDGPPKDVRAAVKAGIKQAARVGDAETEAKLRAKLDELDDLERDTAAAEEPAVPTAEDSAALAVILEEIAKAPKSRRDALIRAARSYGVRALREHGELVGRLPADVRRRLEAPARTRARRPSSHGTKSKKR